MRCKKPFVGRLKKINNDTVLDDETIAFVSYEVSPQRA